MFAHPPPSFERALNLYNILGNRGEKSEKLTPLFARLEARIASGSNSLYALRKHLAGHPKMPPKGAQHLLEGMSQSAAYIGAGGSAAGVPSSMNPYAAGSPAALAATTSSGGAAAGAASGQPGPGDSNIVGQFSLCCNKVKLSSYKRCMIHAKFMRHPVRCTWGRCSRNSCGCCK